MIQTFNIVPLSTINPELRRPVPVRTFLNGDLGFGTPTLSQVVDRNWATNAYTVSGSVRGEYSVNGYAGSLGSFVAVPGTATGLQEVTLEEQEIAENVVQPNFNTTPRTMINWNGNGGDGIYPSPDFSVNDSVFPFGFDTLTNTSVGGCYLRLNYILQMTMTPYAFRYGNEYFPSIGVSLSTYFTIYHPAYPYLIVEEGTSINGGSTVFFPETQLSVATVGSISIEDQTKGRQWGSINLYSEVDGPSQTINLFIKNRFLENA